MSADGEVEEETVLSTKESSAKKEEEVQVIAEDDSMVQSQMVLLVDKLTSTNYSVCVLWMEHYLWREALWQCVDAPSAQPTTEEAMRDENVLAAIMLSLADDQLIHVAGKTSAKQPGTV